MRWITVYADLFNLYAGPPMFHRSFGQELDSAWSPDPKRLVWTHPWTEGRHVTSVMALDKCPSLLKSGSEKNKFFVSFAVLLTFYKTEFNVLKYRGFLS